MAIKESIKRANKRYYNSIKYREWRKIWYKKNKKKLIDRANKYNKEREITDYIPDMLEWLEDVNIRVTQDINGTEVVE